MATLCLMMDSVGMSEWGLDDVSPSVFRCTSTPMKTGPIVTCVKTKISPDLKD